MHGTALASKMLHVSQVTCWFAIIHDRCISTCNGKAADYMGLYSFAFKNPFTVACCGGAEYSGPLDQQPALRWIIKCTGITYCRELAVFPEGKSLERGVFVEGEHCILFSPPSVATAYCWVSLETCWQVDGTPHSKAILFLLLTEMPGPQKIPQLSRKAPYHHSRAQTHVNSAGSISVGVCLWTHLMPTGCQPFVYKIFTAGGYISQRQGSEVQLT